jgi:hypothetical protein
MIGTKGGPAEISVSFTSSDFQWRTSLSFHYHPESFHCYLESFHNGSESFHSLPVKTVIIRVDFESSTPLMPPIL